jgi:hypothetical protein
MNMKPTGKYRLTRQRLGFSSRGWRLPVLLLALILSAVALWVTVHPSRSAKFGPATTHGTTKDGFSYEADGKSVSITDYSGTGGAVSIPERINGMPVTTFTFGGALAEARGEGMVSPMARITSIAIPRGVTFISARNYQGPSLTSITVSAWNFHYSSVDGVLYNKWHTTLVQCPGGLKSVTIPGSVTTIGDEAFSECTGLTSLTIPNGVTEIGESAFAGCTGLQSVTIPSRVTSIGENAFSGCTGLTSITVAAGNSFYASVDGVLFNRNRTTLIQYPEAKSGPYTIPGSVTSIGKSTFSFTGCTGLTSVTIPNSVTSIGESAFSGCASLTSIAIPNSVTSIGDYAFQECAGLTSVTIPNSVTSIGDYAFEKCSGLTSVTIPKGVTTVEGFEECTGLTNVTIPNGVTTIGSEAFSGCTGLKSVTIPGSVTAIEDVAFFDCTSLTSVTIPNSVTSIGPQAFDNCEKLISATIPDSVTSIGRWAFDNCKSLESVTIPNGVTSIEEKTFEKCSSLTRVTIPKSVRSIGDEAFSDCGRLTSITVAAPNSPYMSVDGVLFDSGTTTLIQYPAGKSGPYTIPSSVTSIEDYAFERCTGLTAITVAAPNSSYTSVDGVLFYFLTVA